MMSRRRSSGRAHPARYTLEDPLQGLDVGPDEEVYVDSGEDDEFDATKETDQPEDDNEFSQSDGWATPNTEDEAAEAWDDDDDDDAMPVSAVRQGFHKSRSHQKGSQLTPATGQPRIITSGIVTEESDGRLRARGVGEMSMNMAKEHRMMSLFGSAQEDIASVYAARSKWYPQATLPSQKPNEKGIGGIDYPGTYTEAMRLHESTKGWEWYYDRGGEDTFRQRQRTRLLSSEASEPFLPVKSSSVSADFLMGPIKNQKLFSIKVGEALNLTKTWSGLLPQKKSQRRPGWMLNLGGKVQCLDWAPNQHGSKQYLAAAVLQKPPQDYPPFQNPNAPAFSPTPSTPASIQIWTFLISQLDQRDLVTLSSESPPCLDLLLCTSWGPVKQLKWCPVPNRQTEAQAQQKSEVRLGLLAGIWGDGGVRVLDVRFPKSQSPVRIRVVDAAWESKPPKTVFTCVSWLSSNQLAAATADGALAVFDISSSLLSPLQDNSQKSQRPWFYQPVHSSYILSVASGYPSRPYFVCTSSMDGYQRLIDLRSPGIDTMLSQRSRMGATSLLWHDIGQSFFITDENYTVNALSIRRFHMSMACAKANATILSVAASPLHPFILLGATDGSAISTNGLRKVLMAKSDMWHQTWFQHEYRRALKLPPGPTAPEDQDEQDDLSQMDGGQGAPRRRLSRSTYVKPVEAQTPVPPPNTRHAHKPLARFTEGYKAEIFKVWLDNGLPNQYEGVVYNTIYEEETGVTFICWNPNKRCGGWAAAGMADGLVRVEDLAIQVSK